MNIKIGVKSALLDSYEDHFKEIILIQHTCFKCKRRFELDPVSVGFELSKLKKKNPAHYQAICPECRATNKVSVQQMKDDLASVATEIEALVAEHDKAKAEARTVKQAKARVKAEQQKGKQSPKRKAKR